MKSILRTKSLLHRFINYLFYFIVFILGYILGGGNIEKISDFFSIIY